MFWLFVAGQVVAFLLMIAVSVWGSKNVDPETRMRARAGPTGIDWTMSKKTALFWSPVIGAVVLLSTIATSDSEARDTGAMLGLGVLVVLLLAHRSAIRRAAR